MIPRMGVGKSPRTACRGTNVAFRGFKNTQNSNIFHVGALSDCKHPVHALSLPLRSETTDLEL